MDSAVACRDTLFLGGCDEGREGERDMESLMTVMPGALHYIMSVLSLG